MLLQKLPSWLFVRWRLGWLLARLAHNLGVSNLSLDRSGNGAVRNFCLIGITPDPSHANSCQKSVWRQIRQSTKRCITAVTLEGLVILQRWLALSAIQYCALRSVLCVAHLTISKTQCSMHYSNGHSYEFCHVSDPSGTCLVMPAVGYLVFLMITAVFPLSTSLAHFVWAVMVWSIILTTVNARIMAAAYIWIHAVALRCIAAVHMT